MRFPEAMAGLDGAGERLDVYGKIPRSGDDVARTALELSRIADAIHYLRPAMRPCREFAFQGRKPPAGLFGFVAKLDSLPASVSTAGFRAVLGLERALPSGPSSRELLQSLRPDVVVLTPLVEDVRRQGELVRGARRLGIPTVGGVASWDNLTTSSLIHQVPDKVLVWNEAQRQEAIELHEIPAERIEVTGAQSFDRWFDRAPHRTRAAFLREAGLQTEARLLLYVGSVAKDSRPDAEKVLVDSWIDGVRRSTDPTLREASILIRPHPYNRRHWTSGDVQRFTNVALWPETKGNTVTDDGKDDYFDSLYHSDAVMGINTSAMIEAAIVGTPVFTIRSDEIKHLQDGTLHFRYLLPENGGCAFAADSVEEHVRQLSGCLASPDTNAAMSRNFVRTFIRPHGLTAEATPRVADLIERAAREGAFPWQSSSMSLVACRVWLAISRLFRVLRSTRAGDRTVSSQPLSDARPMPSHETTQATKSSLL